MLLKVGFVVLWFFLFRKCITCSTQLMEFLLVNEETGFPPPFLSSSAVLSCKLVFRIKPWRSSNYSNGFSCRGAWSSRVLAHILSKHLIADPKESGNCCLSIPGRSIGSNVVQISCLNSSKLTDLVFRKDMSFWVCFYILLVNSNDKQRIMSFLSSVWMKA